MAEHWETLFYVVVHCMAVCVLSSISPSAVSNWQEYLIFLGLQSLVRIVEVFFQASPVQGEISAMREEALRKFGSAIFDPQGARSGAQPGK